MAKLNIPKRFREGVFKISQLDDRTVQEIRNVLDTTLPSLDRPTKAAISAVESLSQTNKTDFSQVAEALSALYAVKAGADVETDEFVDDIVDAMQSVEEPHLRVPEAQHERFRERMLTLLTAEGFTLASKAHDLQTDDERTFCRARILTDLRPVFGSEVTDGPKGMVIVHLLKLGFHQSSESKHDEFYIALDSDDLQTLKKVVERAELKAATLKSSLPRFPILGVARE